MPGKNSFNSKSVLLIFLLIFAPCWRRSAAQVNTGDAHRPPGETLDSKDGGDDDAFFALRSCHQLLRGDSGEFFSPDYLCSNPSLWCNWTVQVDPGKRIHLYLEDLTPDDVCHLKQDQVHVDEPAGRFGVHKVLQKCWREAKFTTSTNALTVVLLIGGWPNSPYRGFYGRYQAFGPPVIYNPQEVFAARDEKSEPPLGPMEVTEFGPVTNGGHYQPSLANFDPMYDYDDQRSALTPEDAADAEVGENLQPHSGNYSHIYPLSAVPTAPVSTEGTSRSGRDAAHTASSRADSTVDASDHELEPADRRNVDDASTHPDDAAVGEDDGGTHSRSEEEELAAGSEQAADGAEIGPEAGEESDQPPSAPEGPEPGETEPTHSHPNVVEPLSDHRGNHHMFEVAVEVNFSQDVEESWDDLATSLLLSVKSLTGPGPGSQQVHSFVHAAIQSLIATAVGLGGVHRRAVIVSVSTADVNECGTQLVLCDANADCVNRFGSYSCHCRPGFLDESRLGSGGTICVDAKAAGCGSGLSVETKGVYVLFFLLSSLILMLLAAAGMLYRRHHRGAFLVRCRSGSICPPDPDNIHQHHDGYPSPADSDMPPPPPPPRAAPRDAWPQVKELCPAVDLPLLRFSPLVPSDGYLEPRQGRKM
ncbi:hypothetical protein F2P81_009758 [Scophthalmus maximus]|uniref:CUB domain-containing protein n=1 Tax=Scophthalmus maximus TaxID=52904 RepID=A0A6A4T0V1_SCOMX|nr:hypothetical protein F2P81_009758 [Scophthalmus maximus]